MHAEAAPALITRKGLFESRTVRIGYFEARPVSDCCGEVERQCLNAVVLTLSGVFSKHESPRRHVVGTPSQAVFFDPGQPYRIGFPGAIGDRALTLHFNEECASEQFGLRRVVDQLASHGLLVADAMALRNTLWTRLRSQVDDPLEIESMALELLRLCFVARCSIDVRWRASTLLRRTRAVERVKEAVALAPDHNWTVAELATIANLSDFHLCRVFRHLVGTAIHDYVLRERLAHSLERLVDSNLELSAIAHDFGFSSHSHFTARFKKFFGCTPVDFRRKASSQRVTELRKIMTAHPAART